MRIFKAFFQKINPLCLGLFLLGPGPALVAQQKTVSGLVTDQEGRPLSGVHVQWESTKQGVATDETGRFQLPLPKGATLLFSIVGYESQSYEPGQQGFINIRLAEAVNFLEDITITANRNLTSQTDVPRKIKVLDREDIRKTAATELADVLKKTSNVDIIQYPSLLSGVGIRGFRPQIGGINQRTLLLVNGRPAGATNLSLLNLQDVARIEVLKGPASALYGSQAMGGVVNVITRHSQGQVRSEIFAEYGSFARFQTGVSTGGNITEGLDFDLNLHSFDRARNYELGKNNIFREALNNQTATLFLDDGSTETVEDARLDGQQNPHSKFSQYNASLRLGYQLSNTWRIDLRGDRFRARDVEVPGDIANGIGGSSSKNADRFSGEVQVQGDLGKHQVSFKAYGAEEASDFINTRDFSGEAIVPYKSFEEDNRWWGLQVRDVIRLGTHQLTVGVDYSKARTSSQSFAPDGSSQNPFSPNFSLRSTGLYVQGDLHFLDDNLIINPGIRQDFIQYAVEEGALLFQDEQCGEESNTFTSPSLAAQYRILPNLRLHSSIGRAFVSPEAFQIAANARSVTGADSVALFVGNPNLINENSLSWDIGLGYDHRATGISADITYFKTWVNDRIAPTFSIPSAGTTDQGDVVTAINSYENANESRIEGLEWQFAYDFGVLRDYAYSLRVFFNATQIFRADDLTTAPDGSENKQNIFNVAGFNANYGVEYDDLRNFGARLAGRFVGNRFDTDFTDFRFPRIEYPGFMVLDFTTSYQFMENHRLTFFINNLTDENYYEKRGFNLPGRAFYLRYTLTL